MIISSKHPFLTISKHFAEVCQPLMLFNISHVTYLKQFNDGSRIGLSSKPQWIDDYYNLGLFKTSLFEGKPSDYPAGHNVWYGDYDLEVYRYGKEHYNTMHCISITQPYQDACEFYLFSTSPEHSSSINFLINNMDILYHFILFFQDKLAKQLKKAHQHRLIPFTPPTANDQYDFFNKNFFDSMQAKKRQFYNMTHINKLSLHDKSRQIKLTAREIDCVFYLINNKSVTKTADLMSISRRTLESYLENIKNKFNCSSKEDLFAKLKEFELIRFARG